MAKTDPDDLTERALRLPQRGRAALAARLIESLSTTRSDALTDEEWAAEILRRLERARAGRSGSIPAETVMKDLKRSLRRR